jgi:hypothetical protein
MFDGGTFRGICKVVQSPYHFHHTTPPSAYHPPKVVFQYPIGVLPGQKIWPQRLSRSGARSARSPSI